MLHFYLECLDYTLVYAANGGLPGLPDCYIVLGLRHGSHLPSVSFKSQPCPASILLHLTGEEDGARSTMLALLAMAIRNSGLIMSMSSCKSCCISLTLKSTLPEYPSPGLSPEDVPSNEAWESHGGMSFVLFFRHHLALSRRSLRDLPPSLDARNEVAQHRNAASTLFPVPR